MLLIGRSIEIPLNNHDGEVLVVDVDDLASTENENAIISILTNEAAPLRLYLEFAREYFEIGMNLEFERCLRAAAAVSASGQPLSRDPQICEVLYTLATYYIDVARGMSGSSLAKIDAGDKDYSYIVQQATECVNKADNIDSRNIWVIIAKGNLFLLLNKVDDAARQFKTAVELDACSIAAHMGLASASVMKGDYKVGLECYQKVLCLGPDLKSDVRVSIGICYFKLHMLPEARKSFERALELDARNDLALLHLAVIDWNEARLQNSENELREAAKKLNRCFEENPLNPLTLLLMGERALFAKEYEKVDLFYQLILENASSPSIKFDAYALKAKCLHSEGNYREANEFYAKACEGAKTALNLYGLGKTYIFLAIEYFSKLQAVFAAEGKGKPDDRGFIDEPFAQLELASVYESQDSKTSLADLEKAKEYFQKCLETFSDDMESDLSITVLYNLGRLKEEQGDLEGAEKIYNDLLEKRPAYIDARLRIASIMINSGKVADGRTIIKEAIEIDKKAISAYLLLGNSLYEDKSSRDNLTGARKVFEEVLQTINKHEPYAFVGNINVVFARLDPKNRDTHIRRAFEFFDKALRLDPKNVYAAAGIAIGLVETGRLNPAREVLSQIQECATNIPMTAVNLAHVLVELGQFKSAITLYEKVLKRFYENRNALIFQCLSRAYYIVAKSSKDPAAMLKSLDYIQRAVHIEPSKMALWYDLALVKQQYAQVLNEQPSDKRSLTLLHKAMKGLEVSRKTFTFLSENVDERKRGYDVKHAKERASYCKDVTRISEKKIHETDILERQKEERLRAIRDDQMRLAKEKEEKERAYREEEERKRSEIEKKRRELMQKMQIENEKSREMDQAEEPPKKSSKRAKDDFISDNERNSDSGAPDEGERKPKRSKSGKPRQLKRKRVVGSSDEDERKETKKAGKASALSTEFVDSDEEVEEPPASNPDDIE
nr:protein required for normal CLN1 and CLN2 G1 cyclin expression [Phlyctochytrium planicorne]